MTFEKSCGAVVFRNERRDGALQRYVLMIKHSSQGHYSFPKGHVEAGETEIKTAEREVFEETGLRLTSYRYRGIVTFVSDKWQTEYMHLFTADGYTGEVGECNEGNLEWVKKTDIASLPIWRGDLIFLRLLAEEAPFFSLKLVYEGERLAEAILNGRPIDTEECNNV